MKDKLEKLYESTAVLLNDVDFEPHDNDFTSLFKALKIMQVKVLTVKNEKANVPPAISSSFKLDRIKLPQFSGNFSEWQSFHDLFLSSVHKNSGLSGVEKMVHLKACLTGEAACIISSYQATETNYADAWNLVIKRYNNPREIIFSHIRKFDELKIAQGESASGLRSVSDIINECTRSLKVLSVPVEHWDLILIYYSLKKLDPVTRKEWSLLQDDDLPTLTMFIEFLENRARALADISFSPNKSSLSSSQEKKKISTSHHVSKKSPVPCVKCSDLHPLHMCQEFLKMSTDEKRKFVSEKQLCFNCFYKSHSASQCKMKFACKKCGKRHSTLLHTEQQQPTSTQSTPVPSRPPIQPQSSGIEDPLIKAFHGASGSNNVVLMGTLVVMAVNSNGEKIDCRVFMDPGSESHFVSEQCVKKLNLQSVKACVPIKGIGGVSGKPASGSVNLRLISKVEDFHLDIDALVLKTITGLLPRIPCESTWKHLKDLQLSDPHFYQPGEVDILLGAKITASLMYPQIIKGAAGSPVAQNTKFGWMLSGETLSRSFNDGIISSNFMSSTQEIQCDTTLEKFWTFEEPETQECHLSAEDAECENLFVSTTKRNKDGNYKVELPFKKSATPLGNSRDLAVKRFLSLERKLIRFPLIKNIYTNKMRENINLKFMEQIPIEEVNKKDSECYYMPHHVVTKESSSTTKHRIVFDASAKTTTYVSLNDVLMTGKKLQVDLMPLLIRFRSYLVAMASDIEKFYPQFHVKKEHADFQRVVWREEPYLPLQDYRMLRVTFGVTSAPYLAIRCLHQLADDEKIKCPLVFNILKEDFLVDNLLSGSNDVESALNIQHDILKVMELGNLKLREWMSNSSAILDAVPQEHRASELSLLIGENESLRTVGILWQPNTDTFGIKIEVPDISQGSSKRKVLSSIARIFDPLGWLSPVTVKFKILLQEVWKAKLGWDSPLPADLHKKWISYCQELQTLEQFRIDRCTMRQFSEDKIVRYEMHGYCDASKVAYSACVYIRTVDQKGHSVCTLVSGKTKVAPLKIETIPRLELCGAVLLAKLIQTIQGAMKTHFDVVRCWSDSTSVIGWLTSKQKLEVFVVNRVRKILSIISDDKWSHIKGEENPADPASRGISAYTFLNHNIWLHGPTSLLTTNFESDQVTMIAIPIPKSSILKFIDNCSSFSKMKRIIAYTCRFLSNSKAKAEGRITGPLTADDISSALLQIVRVVQKDVFNDEINKIKSMLTIKSKLKLLVPFIDENGILRVGGRLQKSFLRYDQKHPILLPKNHNFTLQVIKYFHLTHLHAGPQLLLALIRQQFWIVRGPDVVKDFVRKCVVCHRHNPKTNQQIMGQLPFSRVNPSRPFSQTGFDYAGPFILCLRPGRNPITMKSYISLFLCMSTRAVHLELVSDLSTPAFIGALSRFVARRGRPSDVYSDGGKNFLGAGNEIRELYKFINTKAHQENISEFFLDRQIKFHVNPPLSPHHGGYWEAGIKSMKYHLRRIMEDRRFSIEEFLTLLSQVESCLNCRPLTPLSNDPNDFSFLTPGHFLTGGNLSSLPQRDLTSIKENRLTRWELVQQVSQHFWKRWSTEYLQQLQARPKWYAPQPNLKVGDLVLLRDEEPKLGPMKWKLGRIVRVYPGSDGNIRVCDVKVGDGSVYKRPIVKLSPLPIDQ